MPREATISEMDVWALVQSVMKEGFSGRYIESYSITADKFKVDDLGRINQDLGDINAGSLTFGDFAQAHIRIASKDAGGLDHPIIGAWDDEGWPIFIVDAKEGLPCIFGKYDEITQHFPIEIERGGAVYIYADAIVAGTNATTLLTGDYFWLGANPALPWQGTGVGINVAGIVGFSNGVEQFEINSFRGDFRSGPYNDVVMDAAGFNMSLPDSIYEPSSYIKWYHGDVGSDTEFYYMGAQKSTRSGVTGYVHSGYVESFGRASEDSAGLVELILTAVMDAPGASATLALMGYPLESQAVLTSDIFRIVPYFTDSPDGVEMILSGFMTAQRFHGASFPRYGWPSHEDVAPADIRRGEIMIGQVGGTAHMWVGTQDGNIYRFDSDSLVGYDAPTPGTDSGPDGPPPPM